MESNARDRIIPGVQLDRVKDHSPTPDPKTQPLDPQRELARHFEAYKKTFNEIEKLVRRMNNLKIYSCDEYEMGSCSTGWSGTNCRWLYTQRSWRSKG